VGGRRAIIVSCVPFDGCGSTSVRMEGVPTNQTARAKEQSKKGVHLFLVDHILCSFDQCDWRSDPPFVQWLWPVA
jgi:hypothetical protein